MLLAVYKKATAFAGAFFVSVIFVSVVFATQVQAEQCVLDKRAGPVQKVRVDYVFDGDTVKLKDGRKIRLMAINTPEVEREDKPGEAYADAAKIELTKLVDKNNILLQVAGEDHYGRTLGYLFSSEGSLLAASLVRQGLAYQIFMEAADTYTVCLKNEEKKARRDNKGLWKQPVASTRDKPSIHSGFMVISGTVKSISRPKKSNFVWIELDGDLVLRVPRQIASLQWLNQIKEQKIEARGWIKDRSNNKKPLKKNFKRWMMLIYQTDSVRIGE